MADRQAPLIPVALCFYRTATQEEVRWVNMPQVPAVGDTVHFSLDGTDDNIVAWHVFHVSWADDEMVEGWHAEVGLR